MYIDKSGNLNTGYIKESTSHSQLEVDNEIRIYFYQNKYDVSILKKFLEYSKEVDRLKVAIKSQLQELLNNPVESLSITEAVKRNLFDPSRKESLKLITKFIEEDSDE